MAETKKFGLFRFHIATVLSSFFLKKTRFCFWMSARTIKCI